MKSKRKFHYIYKTTCRITGRFYVGMHSTDNLSDGYLGSGKFLGYSLTKHGRENHKIEIVEFTPCRETLKAREKDLVCTAMLSDSLCMNLKLGGDGGWDHLNTDSQIQRVKGLRGQARMKELRNNPDWIATRSRNTSESLKNAYAEGRRDTKPPSWAGRKHSEETKALLRKPKNIGEKNSQFGTCWVTDGVKPIKIKKEQLDEYIQNGYSRGRRMPS